MVSSTSLSARIFKTVSVVVGVIICILLVWYLWMLWKFCGPNDQIHKYLMPGKYSTYLSAGKYSGWYFEMWLSKQIKANPLAQHCVVIEGNTGESIPKELLGGGEGDSYQGKKGEVDFFFEVKKSGKYRVSSNSNDRFVFVIVPESWTFPKSADSNLSKVASMT